MPGVFDAKYFNAEVFQKYYDSLENQYLNTLINSRAIRERQDLARVLPDQVGGNYLVQPISGNIGGTAVNYDGATNITADTLQTYMHGRIVTGRAKGWTEKDFTFDLTGKNFMNLIAGQVHEYWDHIDQLTILKILEGVFSMASTGGAAFVAAHTLDITAATNSEGKTGIGDATTLNTAMQKACGDRKSRFSMAIMHSVVATGYENLKLLTYAKQSDANGLERDVALGTINGRLVLVDDECPVDTSGNDPVYTTYLFGDGAIEYTNCGAKVPSEIDRDPATNGGQDTLYTRQRKCFAPYGITFTNASIASKSPTDAELATAANWDLVKTSAGAYIPHKLIPIARIKSLG
jgi:hypothetical protein